MRITLLAALRLSIGAFAVAASAAPVQQPDLSGVWTIDVNRSEDPAIKFKALFPEQHKDGWFSRGEHDGSEGAHHMRHGGGEFGGRRNGDEADGRGREGGGRGGGGMALRALVTTSALKIAKSGSGFEFDYGSELRRDIRPNPLGHVYSASGRELTTDNTGETLAWWDDASLVIETRTRRGAVLTERYTRDGTDGHLNVTYRLRLPKGGEEVGLARVFVPAS
jgi:hypothetical protein